MVPKLKLALVFLFVIVLASSAKERVKPFIINNIEFAYNIPINQISNSFFDAFNKYSLGNSNEFTFRNYPGISLNVEIPGLTDFTVSVDWINLMYNSNFGKNSVSSFNSFYRTFSENFEFNFVPLSLSLFLTPFEADFKTLFHFQFGVSFDKAVWNEYISSEYEDDPKKGLQTTKLIHFSPFFAFGIRNVFPFDINDNEQILQNFFFETKFCFAYRNIPLLKRISNDLSIQEKVTILPFSIVFLFGINLYTKSFFNN